MTTSKIHYTSIDTLFNIINNYNKEKKVLTFWASNIYMMNDKEEYLYGYNFLTKAIDVLERKLQIPARCRISKIFDDYPEENVTEQEIHKKIIDFLFRIDNSPFVMSFSNNEDSLHMWNLYGDHGKGVALVFKDCLEKNNNGLCSNIEYGPTLNDPNLIRLLNTHLCWSAEEASKIDNKKELYQHKLTSLSDIMKIVCPFVKNPSYSCEQEYRMSFLPNDVRFRSNGRVIIPYIPIDLPVDLLEKIIVGPCADEKNIGNIRYMLHTCGIRGVVVEKTAIPYRIL